MIMRIKLNDEPELVLFDDVKLTLSRGSKVVQLNVISANCLKLLLKAPGQSVTLDTILEVCWRRRGIVVTASSVRQVIKLLRSAFFSLGVKEECIVTLHGVGYLIEADIVKGEVRIQSKPWSDKIQQDLDTTPCKKKFTLPIMMSIVFAFFCSIMIAVIIKSWGLSTTILYRSMPDEGGYHLFMQGEYSLPPSVVEQLQSFADKGWLTIPPRAYIYVNNVTSLNNISAFICNGPMNKDGSRCNSVVYTQE